MKTRNGFVSNSSSTSFVIVNKTDKRLDLEEFVKENPQLIEESMKEFDWFFKKFDTLEKALEQMVKEAKEKKDYSHKKVRPLRLSPGENLVTFGDEDGTLIGRVYDYILRDGGESKRFRWWFDHFER